MTKRYRYWTSILALSIFGMTMLSYALFSSLSPGQAAKRSQVIEFEFSGNTSEIRTEVEGGEVRANRSEGDNVLFFEKYSGIYILHPSRHGSVASCKHIDFHASQYRCIEFANGMNQNMWVWTASGKALFPEYVADIPKLPSRTSGTSVSASLESIR